MTTTVTRNRATLLLATRELRAGSIIGEEEVRAICRRWSPRSVHRNHIDLGAELCDLRMALPMRVSDVQAEKGLAWWRSQLYTRTGEQRRTKFTEECEGMEPGTMKELRRILNRFSHFELEDFNFEYVGSNAYPFPVYTMCGRDGESMSYVARPWQRGGCYLIS